MSKKVLIPIAITVLLGIAGVASYGNIKSKLNKPRDNSQENLQNSAQADAQTAENTNSGAMGCGTQARPDPMFDDIVWTVPDCGSPTRLAFPYTEDEVFGGTHTYMVGYGLAAGGHIEGLDHVWIELKKGTPARSWGDGTITGVARSGDEYHISVDYGHNLSGIHMEIDQPAVKIGDVVKAGDIIGTGKSFQPTLSSGEFTLVDSLRDDGIDKGNGTSVSPYDYLKTSDKEKVVTWWNKHYLEPTQDGQVIPAFNAYQPYLTNAPLLHSGNEGKITGTWLLTTKWELQPPIDIITFIEASTPYYTGNVVLSAEDESGGDKFSGDISGTFEVDYPNHRLKITTKENNVYYGIFELDETSDRARLKLEYQADSYPTAFSDKAASYIERTGVERRGDAVQLGVRETS